MGPTKLKHVLDSVILIDHFNGIEKATRFLSDHHEESAVSVITRAEVLTGFDAKTSRIAGEILDRFPHLAIDKEIADRAARLRRRFRWKLPDALQAAVAEHHGLFLVTRNTKDFHPDHHDFVISPYEI